MGGPEKDPELEAARRAVEDAGRKDDEPLEPEQAAAAKVAADRDAGKGDTPGAAAAYEANARGANPNR